MTDEERDAMLQKIDTRLANIERSISRLEQSHASVEKEKHATKRQFKGRRKFPPRSNEDKPKFAPRYKRRPTP